MRDSFCISVNKDYKFLFGKKSRQHYIFFENIMLIWWGLETPSK